MGAGSNGNRLRSQQRRSGIRLAAARARAPCLVVRRPVRWCHRRPGDARRILAPGALRARRRFRSSGWLWSRRAVGCDRVHRRGRLPGRRQGPALCRCDSILETPHWPGGASRRQRNAPYRRQAFGAAELGLGKRGGVVGAPGRDRLRRGSCARGCSARRSVRPLRCRVVAPRLAERFRDHDRSYPAGGARRRRREPRGPCGQR